MELQGLSVIVIGAGIGGLATAVALRQRGAQVRVLEQARAIAEVGAGLQVSPNGFAVLRALGLGEGLAAASIRGEGIALFDHRERPVLRLDLSGLTRRDYHFVHRSDLIAVLAQGAAEAGILPELSHRVVAVAPGARPQVHLEQGAPLSADLVIGADGLHSVLRGALNGVAKPRFTGQAAWRAVVLNTERRGAKAHVHMGAGRHIVSYPLRDGALLNIVAVCEQADWVAESWSQSDDPDNLRAAFADFGPAARALLDRVSDVRKWGLFRHPVAPHWTGPGVALVGDAAHPTLPFMAQGASMALEDAWALAATLSRATDLATGLAAYQALRRPRAVRVIDTATGNAWKYHLRAGPLRMAAHAALRLGGALAPDRMLRRYSWIYDYDITREA